MPSLETAFMDQRTTFITDHRQGLYPVTELCARYGISRKSGYKWLTRFEEHGRRDLADRSRAPPPLSPPDRGRARGPALRDAAEAPGLGGGQAPGLPRAAACPDRLARHQHGQ